MKIRPDLQPPIFCILRDPSLSPKEQEIVSVVQDNLFEVYTTTLHIVSSICLYQYSSLESQKLDYNSLYLQWRFVGAHQTAMSLRNLMVFLRTIKGIVGKIESWRNDVDFVAIRSAMKNFDELFPMARTMRNAVAHPESFPDPSENTTASGDYVGQNFQAGESGTFTFQDILDGDVLTSTWNGEVVTVHLTEQTIRDVNRIVRVFFESFSDRISSFPESSES